jgi:hypothetical protein
VEFKQEDAFMKIDEIKPGAADASCEGDSQNRRQFLNGLGKWSLAVIAAATALRDGLDDIRGESASEFETLSGSERDRPQLIARKKPKKPKGPHTDRAFYKHAQHHDNVSKKKPPGGGIPTPGGTLDRTQ